MAILGTVVASKVVQGNPTGDTYGTHLSILGIGGYQEFLTLAQRNAIPVDILGRLEDDGLSSGRRRLGQLVYVAEQDTVYQLYVSNSVWSGLTESQKVSALANNSNWIVYLSSGGDAIKKKYTKTSHGFGLGHVIAFNGTTYVKKIASAGNTDETLGLVSKVIDADNFEITYAGYIDTTAFTGMSANTTYFVSPSIAGKLTTTEPFNAGEENRPILITQTTTQGLVVQYRGQIVTDTGYSGATPTSLRIQRTTLKSAHGFVRGDVLRYSGNTYQKAIASQPINDFPIGMVSRVLDANTFVTVFAGYVDGMAGTLDASGNTLQANKLYYLSPTLAGKLTPVVPSVGGQLVKPVFQTFTTDDGVFINQRALPVGALTGLTINANTIAWTNITGKPSGMTTGFTNVGTGAGLIVRDVVNNRANIKTIRKGTGISVTNNADDITLAVTGITATTTIGNAEDGSYADGIFTDFTPTTPIGTAVDRFNELFTLVFDQPANLGQITGTSSFVSGKLSFGASKSIAGFGNVSISAGNSAIDINGTYSIGGTRLGITNVAITGIINDNVIGNISGIPYLSDSFSKGNVGKLILQKNGAQIAQLILSGTTAATSNAYLSVSSLKTVKGPTGGETPFKYRTGTFTIPVSGMTNGFNYIKIIHTGSTVSAQSNFIEWVYDPDASNILISGTTGLTNLTLSGTKNISGVIYRTSGTVDYSAAIGNAYKNIYSSSSTAISFPNKENLDNLTNLNVTGPHIINRTGSTLTTLPNLDTAATNPQNGVTTIVATHPINATRLLGNIGSLGRIRSGLAVSHPVVSQAFSGGLSTLTGFLFYNVNQTSDLQSENFDGEVNRLEARDYTVVTYNNLSGTTYNWSSTQNLISGNAQHNTGLLVFNGELMYPNAAYLTSTYGITAGNFGAVTYAPGGNPNYTAASGVRSFYRRFKSTQGSTLANLTIQIDHTGNASNFIITGGTGGTPTSNNVKVECLIVRTGGQKHGWFNPFASFGNPEGISNTSIVHSGSTTTVTCTLSVTPRIAINDIVVFRVMTSATWSNRINSISIPNIV